MNVQFSPDKVRSLIDGDAFLKIVTRTYEIESPDHLKAICFALIVHNSRLVQAYGEL